MRKFFLLCLLICSACSTQNTSHETENTYSGNELFRRLSATETGIDFINAVEITDNFDVFRYRNFYNGGGVGIGDINNDGLADVYFTSNMGDNRLYLNKGNFKFEDITVKAGIQGTRAWSTGVSLVDLNSDGLLDIYVCNAGDVKGLNRENELFINNGNLTFTEQAKKYGLADRGFSTHAAFFDYDKDGDLDCYVLNNSYRPVSTLGYRNLRNVRDEYGGHKLYRNDKGHFTDVSENAGIYGSVIGFGLGVTVGDVNQDNWPDLYISNDFYERDYLYINKHDGTFAEQLENYMGHISMFSMGADLADLNNDGFPEIFSTDMLPQDQYRLKTLTSFETYDVYQLRLKNGYYHQYLRNMLHLNNQDGTFSEVGQMAGVDATDWSWGAIIADFDNDLYKEIYVCNGIYKDVTNQDFVEFLGSSEQMRAAIEGKKIDFRNFTDRMPSVKLGNYMFHRSDSGRYNNVSDAWGLGEPGFSNGAAYGDLDNDGDLDLVVNNVNQEVFVYQNQLRQQQNSHYLAVTFKGYGENTFALGASVKVFAAGQVIAHDNMPIRGFQSSMDYKMVIGMGNVGVADSLQVTWPDDKIAVLKEVKTDQHLVLDHTTAETPRSIIPKKTGGTLLQEIPGVNITHTENDFNEFDRDRLLYHMMSTQGPALAVADLNSDGADDFYLGGAMGAKARLYLQQRAGFTEAAMPATDTPLLADDVDATFFDADGDKDLDLYVVSGGTENLAQSMPLLDRYYENTGVSNGTPIFKQQPTRIPALYQSGSCVRPADVDNDGDLDLFVGTRVIPSYYGLPADQFLLINDGSGKFAEASATWAPEFTKLGMVTDAAWFDADGNGFPDLLVVGEWMPPILFTNDGKRLTQTKQEKGLKKTEGLWNSITAADLDNDGDTDFVLGNLGTNSMLKASPGAPLFLHVADFDQNGSVEPVFTSLRNGKQYPLALRQDIIKQMSSLKKKFVYYKDYADKSLDDIFDRQLLERATTATLYETRSCLLISDGAAGFTLKPLPWQAQVAPVYGIAVADLDKDKRVDLVLGGNLYAVKPQAGRYDALHGLVLKGDGKGNFTPLPSRQSGLIIEGEVRHIAQVRSKGTIKLAFARNNDTLKFYSIRK